MRLLIVVPDQARATGNWVTATRLSQGWTARGHAAAIHATTGDPAPLAAAIAAFGPDLALLLHAWRGGRPWLATGAAHPFAVLLTGTDVNTGLTDPVQGPVIDTVLRCAAAVLVQNPLIVATLRRDRPQLAGRVHYLPAGATLGAATFPLRERLAPQAGEWLLLCPAGIRPVKGQLELLALCAPLVAAGHPLRLAFCGPVLDQEYGRRLFAALANHPWATWLGSVPPDAMPDAMRQADLIVNNSSSEGLPNVLVEATVLGRPILARDIPGNAAVVADGVNGLLYRDAESFCAALGRLRQEPTLRARLSRPAPERFAPAREIDTLENLCRNILAAPHDSRP